MSKFKTLKDAISGYWHAVLDLVSSLLTTFNTPWGKFQWLFGLKIASDVLQERPDSLRLFKGVHGVADDILTHGKTEMQHDGRLLTLLETAKMNNLSLNPQQNTVQVYRMQALQASRSNHTNCTCKQRKTTRIM